jgi:hypothetical protein
MKFNFSSMRRGVVVAGSALMLVLAISACNKDNNNDDVNVPVAGLMAFNLAPDVSSAGVALSGNNLSSSLPFGSYTGGYLGVYTGDRPVESYNAASGGRLASGSFNFEDSAYYSLFVIGANNNYRNVIVEDKFDELTSSNQAYIRYINAIPDSSRPTVTIASGGSNVVNEIAAFASVSEFKAVNAGDVAIDVTNGGTVDVDRTITVESRKVYTVLISGVPGSTGSDNVQIKYIVNGQLDETAARQSSASARSAN